MANFQRQLDILPPQEIVHPINFIGLGGIGSPTIYTIRKMGFSNLTLWDPDTVEPHNLPSQHYDTCDLTKFKTEGIARQLKACLDTDCKLILHQRKYASEVPLEGIVISGVDSMEARSEIWKGILRSKVFVPLYIDGRIGIEWNEDKGTVTGEWIEVFTIVPPRIGDQEFYEEHLFPDEDAAPLRCTAQAVAYMGQFMAGFIGANLRKWVMKVPYHRYILYDCLTNQIMISIL